MRWRIRSLCCSFCRRSEREVRSLVAGRRAFICGSCVARAQEIIDESRRGTPLAAPEAPVSWGGRLRDWWRSGRAERLLTASRVR